MKNIEEDLHELNLVQDDGEVSPEVKPADVEKKTKNGECKSKVSKFLKVVSLLLMFCYLLNLTQEKNILCLVRYI